MRVALVHDWLNGMRGGEKILEVLCELFPHAVIHTLMCDREKLSPTIARMQIHTSALQSFPMRRSKYRYYLPLFPWLIGRFDFSGYDLVFSTSHCVAKGARPAGGVLHICYCLTPMRYVWFFGGEYFHHWGPARLILAPAFSALKRWDLASLDRVHRWLAISETVARRVKTIYNRNAEILYPPVDTAFFTPEGTHGDYYLVVSALVPYKRVDLAVDAFTRLGLPLKVVGEGPERDRLEQRAGPTVEFLGWLPDMVVRDLYRRCRAFIFPGEEDFGITPLEAQACGRPVIAYGRGGARETVIDGKTGLFFTEQSPGALIEVIREERGMSFEPADARHHARRFDREIFKKELEEFITRMVAEWQASGHHARKRGA